MLRFPCHRFLLFPLVLLGHACDGGSKDVEAPVCVPPDATPSEGMPPEGMPPIATDGGSESPVARRELDLRNDADNVYAWRKTRGSLDPEQDVVFYWTGFIYALSDADPADFQTPGPPRFGAPIFAFDGFNVARFAEDGFGGYQMVSREVSVYRDPATGEIVDCWRNALHPDRPRVRVLHVANDPVNFGVGPVNALNLGDRVNFFSDVLLSYRSPLAGEDYAEFSAGDVYQSRELFNFYVSRDHLEDESIDSVPVEISWSRVGQYLPWMQMGERPGELLYQTRGYKVLDGVDGLPEDLVRWTREVAGEEFLSAPDSLPTGFQSNATSWRVFREVFDAGEYDPSCE